MQIEVLGSGGAITTPRPGCDCRVCKQARARGLPYSRTGPSYFVHGPDILVDTPEESKHQLNRAGLGHIPACIFSHWHPDHTMGRRVFESNIDLRAWPPVARPTDVYLPEQVAIDTRRRLGLWDHLTYMQSRGMVRIIELHDGEELALNGYRVQPFRLFENYVYAFLIEGGSKRVLLAPDELHGWRPHTAVQGVDLAVLPTGITEFDVFTGERLIPAEHPILQTEATFRETLDLLRALGARRVVLAHIEEVFGLTHDDLHELAAASADAGLPVTFAYDTMRIDV